MFGLFWAVHGGYAGLRGILGGEIRVSIKVCIYIYTQMLWGYFREPILKILRRKAAAC